MNVPARIVGRFPPVDAAEWRRMDNNTKAALGKARFLELEGALDATSERVRSWLVEQGLEVGSEWVEVSVAPDLPPRLINLGYSSRCVDAFMEDGWLATDLTDADGNLVAGGVHRVVRGCELKVSGYGVCGLTVSEERLLRAGRIRVYAINPVRGLIGEMDSEALLSVPRRMDGIPVGQAFVEWTSV